MKKEIGGYIEFEHYHGKSLYENAIKLNCGRNCLAYLIIINNIKHIYIPYFLCDSIINICEKYGVKVSFYHIGKDFLPIISNIDFSNEWIYLVNYYGQITNNKLIDYASKYKNLIIDNVQAFFQPPLEHVPTIYSCRKYFGVTDGAYLCTDNKSDGQLEQDLSFTRMEFLFGRFEKNASDFYLQYTRNNMLFKEQPIKQMSLLTENLMHSFEYERIKNVRTENFQYLHQQFEKINMLHLSVSQGAFAYPLFLKNGAKIRKKLQEEKIFIPILWPYVFDICKENDLEYQLAQNVLPLPVDQRYGIEDMRYIVNKIRENNEDV